VSAASAAGLASPGLSGFLQRGPWALAVDPQGRAYVATADARAGLQEVELGFRGMKDPYLATP
jgi:hypothetical protein